MSMVADNRTLLLGVIKDSSMNYKLNSESPKIIPGLIDNIYIFFKL